MVDDTAREPASEPASDPQRRRSAALAIVLCALALVGAASHRTTGGQAPQPCSHPALSDGVLVCDGKGAPPGARAWLAGQKLDVNSASERELEQIPGVGPSLAHAILTSRSARGRFTSFAELDDVPGIGPKTLAKLTAFLEVR